MFKYRWTETEEIKKLLSEIEALKIIVTQYPPRPEVLESIRRHNLLKSAVFSARVENIPAEITDPNIHKQLEVQNLLSAYRYLSSPQLPKALSLTLISRLHLLVLKNLSVSPGRFRHEPWAIFNTAGVAVYLAPAHFSLPQLMTQFVAYIGKLSTPVPITAAVAQFIFEKIHPFADGNGRVGRLISSYFLNSRGYRLGGLAVFEEYTDNHRDEYYQALTPDKDCTEFIAYFLRSLVESVHFSLSQITAHPISRILPRRQEILDIIRDHPLCSFDFIKRRFPTVASSTLHYDLQQLQKAKLIVKHGVSRGVVYSSTSS